MRFDYQCNFDLKKCVRRLGLEEKGRVQKAIDEAFLRGVDPYIPLDDGTLRDSGKLYTVRGTGLIVWDAENKARRLYYGEEDWNWSNGGVQVGGLRGPYWAQRYIQNGGKKEIEEVARKAVKQ